MSISNLSSGNPEGQQTVKEFTTLFWGRTDAWGALPPKCNHKPVTLAHYERHRKGEVSLGIYPLLDDGTCSWITADLEQPGTAPWHNGPDDVMPALTSMKSLDYCGADQDQFLEKMKSKGWRVWLFLSAPVPARHVRRLFHAALSRAELPPSLEIFPKQDFVKKSLLEPGWAGELNREELNYIRSQLGRSSLLRRRWGVRPSARRFSESHIRSVAKSGLRAIRRRVLASAAGKE
jgi:hypothetical protein